MVASTFPKPREGREYRGSTQPADGPAASRNRVSEAKIVDYWDRQIKAAEILAEQNKKDAVEAEQFFRGDPEAWMSKKTWDGPTTQENVFYRDVMVLSGQVVYSDPKALVTTARGEKLAAMAKATQKLANKTIKQQKYKEQIRRALIRAIFRNIAFVYHSWDPFTGLPSISYCNNEVWPDNDCEGDLANADWIVEEFYPALTDILADGDISPEVKRELLRTKTLLKFYSEETAKDAESGKGAAAACGKVRAFRVWSKRGAAPFKKGMSSDGDDLNLDSLAGSLDDDEREANETPAKSWAPGGGKVGYTAHAPMGGKTDLGEVAAAAGVGLDPKPEQDVIADQIEAKEEEDRVLLVLVDGYRKIVKQGPWPLDHFGRREWPYSMIRLTDLPGDIYGVSLFKVLRPLLRIMNFILSFWFADARESVRRDNFYDEDALADASQEEKLSSGVHNQWIKTKKGRVNNSVYTHEYAPRGDSPIFRLYEVVKKAHDDTSGINDIARGSAGDVEKTKAEAQMLNDRASEALGLIVDSVDDFIRDIASKTVMGLQRHIEKTSTWTACETCKGAGEVQGQDLADVAMVGPGAMVPCPECQGSGHGENVIRKGADWFLDPDVAVGWDDSFTLEQIRAELTVDVEPGSTRRSNQERKQRSLVELFSVVGPIYEKYGLFRPFFEFITRIVLASELPDAEGLAPTQKEIEEGVAQVQAQMQAAMQAQAAQAAPAEKGPTPEQLEIEKRKFALEEEKARKEMGRGDEDAVRKREVEDRDFGHRKALEEQRLQLDRERQVAEQAPTQQVMQAYQQQLAQFMQVQQAQAAERVQIGAQLASIAAALADTVKALQGKVTAIAGASEEVKAAVADALGAGKDGKKKEFRVERDARGRMERVVEVGA